MSWPDIIYPGNKEMRIQMVRKLQQLEDAMGSNFRKSNDLATFLNEKITNANIPMIYVNSSGSLKDNANTLVNQINLIDAELEKIADELKGQLEPDLYKKLTNVDTSFGERIEISQKVGKVISGITGAAVTGVVGGFNAVRVASKLFF